MSITLTHGQRFFYVYLTLVDFMVILKHGFHKWGTTMNVCIEGAHFQSVELYYLCDDSTMHVFSHMANANVICNVPSLQISLVNTHPLCGRMLTTQIKCCT